MYQDYIELLVKTLKNIEMYKDHYLVTSNEECVKDIIDLVTNAKMNKKSLFFVGNGGSAGIASHMTADFLKNGGIRTYNFYDSSLITCLGNDYGYENVFSKPLDNLGNKNDVLIAISSSGNSQNIINAIEVAQQKDMKVITLSGFNQNNMIKGMGLYNIYVPISHYGIVESIHNIILQYIVDRLHELDEKN